MAGPNVIRDTGISPKNNDKDTLTPGNIYDGTIVDTSVTNMTCAVKMTNGVVVQDCVLPRMLASALLGFRIDHIPPPGTRCRVVAGSPSVIMTYMDSTPPDKTNSAGAYSTSGTHPGALGKSQIFSSSKSSADNSAHLRPSDLLEGEFQITNLLGITLSMLTTVAKLAAGDRAKMEAFLLHDLVRIVSHNFKHFTALGQYKIYHDGRNNARFDASSYEHEALGLEDPNEIKVPTSANVAQTDELDTVLPTGRWRYSQFVGFLGDFVNIFISDPVQTAAKIGEDALRSGNARVHLGNDGTFLVQSISEIALERVVRIPVPVEKKRYEDPSGVSPKDYEKLDPQFLKLWELDKENPCKMVFQLREYARWLGSYHSLARFNQQNGRDWKVPNEQECPDPKWSAREKDKDQVNAGQALYKDTYACMRIMKDGSIVHLNGYGTAVCLAGPTVQISAPLDVVIEAGNNVRINAGQDILCLARRNTEVVSIAGGLKLKARTWLQQLCERGSIWLKSDAKNPNEPGYQPPQANDNKMGQQVDPKPLVMEHAVFVEGTKGKVGLSGLGATVVSTGEPGDEDDTSKDVILNATKSSIRSYAQKDVELRPRRRLLVKAGAEFIAECGRVIWEIRSRLFDLVGMMTYWKSALHVDKVRTNTLSSVFVINGPKVGAQTDPDVESNVPLRPHFNHIQKLPDDQTAVEEYHAPKYPESDDRQALEDYTSKPEPDTKPLKKEHPRWDFLSPGEYQRAHLPFFESLTQQQLREDDHHDDDQLKASNYEEWDWSSKNRLDENPYNGTNAPSVGTNAQHLTHEAGSTKNLLKPSDLSLNQLAQKTELAPKPIKFKFRKR